MPHARRASSKNENHLSFPSPLMGEGMGKGDSRVLSHLNPLPRRGEEVFFVLFLTNTNVFNFLTRVPPSPSPLPTGERDRVRGDTIKWNET